MRRQVDVTSDEKSLVVDAVSVEKCLAQLDKIEGYIIPQGSLGIAFVSEETCCRLHQEFFGDPDPTDVMTFPGDPEDDHAGDIAICPMVGAQRCLEENLPFGEELTLYLVHACLHLAGLDDKDPQSVEKMRKGEAVVMKHLRETSTLLAAGWELYE